MWEMLNITYHRKVNQNVTLISLDAVKNTKGMYEDGVRKKHVKTVVGTVICHSHHGERFRKKKKTKHEIIV